MSSVRVASQVIALGLRRWSDCVALFSGISAKFKKSISSTKGEVQDGTCADDAEMGEASANQMLE